jgi:hypothetical protein
MGEAVTEMIAKAGSEDLRFAFQPSKRPRVDYTVAVALKIVSIRMRGFGILPATRFPAAQFEVSQHSGGALAGTAHFWSILIRAI